ncbi:hypothetical protein [Streptomyces sp. NBC_01216]|uniref:hypothetical protein n=1 Tax=unclassified Streptomyces TaxID=2593676 RepID=UPI002E0EBEE6|nr:hypothetical protein OG393_14100 [Streptomyces sp. NBC_01216]
MDISADGPDLAPEWQEADNNLCGVLRGRFGTSAVAECFVRAGWKSRSSSWDAYEVETSWCRVDLDPVDGSDTLLNGVTDPDEFDALAALAVRAELRP